MFRATGRDGVKAMIGTGGRRREARSAVAPELVNVTMAAVGRVTDARLADSVIVSAVVRFGLAWPAFSKSR